MNLIVACDSNYGIGKNNTLPDWKIPGDLKRFKDLTTGEGNNIVIMGKNTFLSLPKGPLPNRTNIVVSKTLHSKDNYIVNNNLKEAYDYANKLISCNSNSKIWLIGGAQIYEEAIKLNLIKEAYVTKLNDTFDCDTYLGKLTIEWIENKDSDVYYF